ncbi:MAG: hypothetical protein M1829_004655 [Trizodia sp. TS-e1964]|nr:MAG: hypothetical protein M1829_004655 [Trizodia sp. TS-e1964]
MDLHNEAVSAIADRVREFYGRKQPFRIYHGTTNSTRQSQLRLDQTVDTSRLTNILNIDAKKMTALVEPNVPMDALVEATLLHGLIPPVVMEFPGITAGGGFAGTSGESSSFRYGYFDRTINWIEIVLPNGDKVSASPSQSPDLFYGAASSFGTLGVTTLLEVQLIRAKTYVELTYHPVSNIPQAIETINQATEDSSVDYLDGIMYSQESGVIFCGRLTDHVNGLQIQRFTRSTDDWFYLHSKNLIKGTNDPLIEAVPIVDYLFRYDRGGFWVGFYAFKYFITPFNWVTRWALDKLLHTRVMYHALHQSGFSSKYIIQDVAIPYAKSEEFFHYLGDHFGHYPIWLCPLKLHGKLNKGIKSSCAGKVSHQLPEFLLNFGVWGPGPTNHEKFVEWNRKFEHKVSKLGGLKWLYAHTYYTEEEFYEIYDRKSYKALREKYHATYLPSVYDKVKADIDIKGKALNENWALWLLALFWGIWPLSGLYGAYQAIFGSEYLLARNAKRS